jgi:hypothetical protein
MARRCSCTVAVTQATFTLEIPKIFRKYTVTDDHNPKLESDIMCCAWILFDTFNSIPLVQVWSCSAFPFFTLTLHTLTGQSNDLDGGNLLVMNLNMASL